MLLKGEVLGSRLTNNLIMELERTHNRGVGVGALQRCEPGAHGRVDARDIPLLYLETKIQNAPVGSPQRQEAQKNLLEEINHRKQIDQNIIEILRLSLKKTDVLDLLTSTRTTGQPVVDDWDCYKTLVKSFKNQCGAKMEYDMKYAGALANICNMGVDVKKSVAAIEEACAH
ncbi:hypothetical protein HID58_002953 [Brassica napus]|uniref:Legumain prodomain domain-containing protein n=1 Tax=Brassica napus TaxID=3708 RepID=A0ABQ8EP14_BRANA|nr:hypothetical protein HID58_002953 [Brassica napus]